MNNTIRTQYHRFRFFAGEALYRVQTSLEKQRKNPFRFRRKDADVQLELDF